MKFGLSSVGGLLNDVTGATSAGKQSQKYALQSAQVNNAYQKEFAQNAHQWEIEDLKKAGLNPILSANAGASASGGGVASGTVSNSGINPIETAIGAWNGYEQARNTGADTNRKNAETANLNEDTLNKTADTMLKKAQMLKIAYENAHTEQDRKRIKEETYKLQKEYEEIEQRIKKMQGGKPAEWIGTKLWNDTFENNEGGETKINTNYFYQH